MTMMRREGAIFFEASFGSRGMLLRGLGGRVGAGDSSWLLR
jgi:hypothetical protein